MSAPSIIRVNAAVKGRMVRLMGRVRRELDLDLDGGVVLTEAATGFYALTPVLAAMSNASRVVAVATEGAYGSVDDCRREVMDLAEAAGAPDVIEFVSPRRSEVFSGADIVTNLGHVRPVDAEAVSMLPSGSVVAAMCEAWELRPEDVDVAACRDREVLVYATDEDRVGPGVFGYSGVLAAKLMLEAGVEVRGLRVVVISGDRFGEVVSGALKSMGASVILLTDLESDPGDDLFSGADAVLVTDYASDRVWFSQEDVYSADRLATCAPDVAVIHLAGGLDQDALEGSGLSVTPPLKGKPHRMSKTLAYLGPAPVIWLHGGGLKVGSVVRRGWRAGLRGGELEAFVLGNSPAQVV